jgi:hypothetical protein
LKSIAKVGFTLFIKVLSRISIKVRTAQEPRLCRVSRSQEVKNGAGLGPIGNLSHRRNPTGQKGLRGRIYVRQGMWVYKANPARHVYTSCEPPMLRPLSALVPRTRMSVIPRGGFPPCWNLETQRQLYSDFGMSRGIRHGETVKGVPCRDPRQLDVHTCQQF